nr:excretory canal abnormal protein 6-like [Ipomoea batatas]
MAGDLFEDLPPPNASANTGTAGTSSSSAAAKATSVEASPAAPPPPKPALKSALKRPKPPQDTPPETSASGKRLRFKTTTDASETQVIEAMQKISSHIKNLSKFGKASKLAIQLIEAGSVKPSTSDHFFAILEAAMSSSTACNEPSVRADYHALFSASQDVVECLSKKQQNSLAVWTIRAVVANDLFTDDSFVLAIWHGRDCCTFCLITGLNFPDTTYCFALRSLSPIYFSDTWCQTGIDILVKHAFDNVSRFTSKQREAVNKLWVSVREQQVRRKQGKSVSGKLDVNGFEYLQQKYANEKISIRHSVGGSGDRKCTQWLG